MKIKYKLMAALVVILITALLCLAILQNKKPDISGIWVNEDKVTVEFFSKGVWLSEDGFEGLGGEWKIHKDKIIMEDLQGNTFEAVYGQNEKGECIILNGEAYYREASK